MSRNFRQAQLLDAFDFDGNEHLRQLAEGFTNIRSGVGTPTVTANDGELFYDTRGMFLYVREGGAWIRAGSAADIPTISSLLDTLSYQTEYTYGSLLPADYISASGDAFHDGAFLTLVFRLGYTVPDTLYGFTTPPGTAATTAEPDVVIQQRNPGINFGGFQQVPFIILKGVELIPQFELGRNIPAILNTLYTRTATTGFEYLTKTASGTYEFTVPPEFEDTNTEYTFADGTGGTFTVTPSDTGVAQTVSVGVTDSGTQQIFNISQDISWIETNPVETFDGVTITSAGVVTFASETDAGRFFSDLAPREENGIFVVTNPAAVIVTDELRLLILDGTTFSLSGTQITFNVVTAIPVPTASTVSILRGNSIEGRIGAQNNLPVSYLTVISGDNLRFTIPNSDTTLIARFNQQLAVPDSRFVIAGADGSHAYYGLSNVVVGVAGTTDLSVDLIARTSYTSTGFAGFAGRTPPFTFTVPTTGNFDLFNIISVQPRTNRFIDETDTPSSYSGSAGQAVRVNSTGTGLEFVEVSEDPIATITAIAAPGNTVSWSPESIFDETLFNGLAISSTESVADFTNSEFTGSTGQLLRTSGTGVVPREMSSLLARAINASGITIVQDDYYTLTFPNAITSGFNNQIAIFRAAQSGSLPIGTGVNAQRFSNDRLGGAVASVAGGGDIPFTVTRYARADIESRLIDFNSNALDLSVTSGSQTISLLTEAPFQFVDATPTINSRILSGNRIFVRIENGADDTYLEVLDASATNVVVNLGAKFTVNGNDRTQDATDTRRISFNITSVDDPVHRALYEHTVVQVAEPAIIDLNGAPVLATGITAEEVRTLLEVTPGTVVAANPTGTDGDDLTRIAIGGTNFNIPSGGGGSTVPFRVTTTDATTSGTAYPSPVDANDFNIQYQPNIETLFLATSTATNIAPGTVIALTRNTVIYTFIVHSGTTFGGFREYRAAPANATVATTLASLPAGNGVTLEGDNRVFDTSWSARPSTSEHLFSFEADDGDGEFAIPMYSGTTLPNITGNVGELFVLLAADGSNTQGVYRRTSATDLTDAAWTQIANVGAGSALTIQVNDVALTQETVNLDQNGSNESITVTTRTDGSTDIVNYQIAAGGVDVSNIRYTNGTRPVSGELLVVETDGSFNPMTVTELIPPEIYQDHAFEALTGQISYDSQFAITPTAFLALSSVNDNTTAFTTTALQGGNTLITTPNIENDADLPLSQTFLSLLIANAEINRYQWNQGGLYSVVYLPAGQLSSPQSNFPQDQNQLIDLANGQRMMFVVTERVGSYGLGNTNWLNDGITNTNEIADGGAVVVYYHGQYTGTLRDQVLAADTNAGSVLDLSTADSTDSISVKNFSADDTTLLTRLISDNTDVFIKLQDIEVNRASAPAENEYLRIASFTSTDITFDTDAEFTDSSGTLTATPTDRRTRIITKGRSAHLFRRRAETTGGPGLPSIVTITDNGTVTEIRPAGGNTSVDINDGAQFNAATLHQVATPILTGFTPLGSGTPARLRFLFDRLDDGVNYGTNIAINYNFVLPNASDTGNFAFNAFTAILDQTNVGAGALANNSRANVLMNIATLFNNEIAAADATLAMNWTASVITEGNLIGVEIIGPEQAYSTGNFQFITGSSPAPWSSTEFLGSLNDQIIATPFDNVAFFRGGVAGTPQTGTIFIRVLDAQGVVLATSNVVNLNGAFTPAQLVDELVANAVISGYSITVGANPEQVAVTRNTAGTFDTTILVTAGTGVTFGTEVVRDFASPVVDFQAVPTVGGNRLVSQINTDVVTIIGDVNPGRFEYVRFATNGDYAVNASGTISGEETFFRGCYRTDRHEGTEIIFMIRRNVVNGGARPVITTWAQWNGMSGENSLDPAGTGMIRGGTTFPTSPAANDLFVLTAAVGAQMPNLYQRTSDNVAWTPFTFGNIMPNTRP